MTVHELKIKPRYYKDVVKGKKRFELRKDDRGFNVGDIVELQEWSEGAYTGRKILLGIAYILRDCEEYGLRKGYCILGL